jgi:hypothetical protein
MAKVRQRAFWLPIVWGVIVSNAIALYAGAVVSVTLVLVVAGLGFVFSWIAAYLHGWLRTITRFVLVLLVTSSAWTVLARVAWPDRQFETSVDSAPDPLNSVFHITLKSGPPLDLNKYQVTCRVAYIEWPKKILLRDSMSYFVRPFGGILEDGDTISEACLSGFTGPIKGLVLNEPPICLDVAIDVDFHEVSHGVEKFTPFSMPAMSPGSRRDLYGTANQKSDPRMVAIANMACHELAARLEGGTHQHQKVSLLRRGTG